MLDPEDVAHMAAVLERRPRVSNRMRPERLVIGLGEDFDVSVGERTKSVPNVLASDCVVHEPALVAMVHTTKLDRCAVRSAKHSGLVRVAAPCRSRDLVPKARNRFPNDRVTIARMGGRPGDGRSSAARPSIPAPTS